MTGQNNPPGWAGRFFGPLYGELYRRYLLEPERSRGEAEFATELLDLKKRRVLDLAAGFGRHSRHLAVKNTVVALDLNRVYLQTAVRSVRGKTRERLLALEADMRRLPLAREGFDAVLLLFNSFGYFSAPPATAPDPGAAKTPVWKLPEVFYQRQLVPEDFGIRKGAATPQEAQSGPAGEAHDRDRGNELVLREIARVLRPGGGFLIEVPNPRPVIEAVRAAPRRHVVAAEYEIEEEYSYGVDSGLLRNRTRFRLGSREEDGEYALRLYSRAEMNALLRRSGLKPVEAFGDYEGNSYRTASSDTLLIHARKL